MRQARGLLEPLVAGALREGGKAVHPGPLLDRSEEAYACLYLPGGAASGPVAGPAAALAVTGRWSPDLVALRMDWSCGWVRHEPPSPPYWSARRGSLEVGSPTRGLLLAAAGRQGTLEGMLARGPTAAAGPVERARAGDPRVDSFLAGAALYACLPVLSSRRAPESAAEARSLPLRELWLAARRQGDLYELGALAALTRTPAGDPGAPNARVLTGLVRLAAAAWLRKAGIGEVTARLRAMEIEVEAEGLTVRGLRLSEAELRAMLASWLPAGGEGVADRGD